MTSTHLGSNVLSGAGFMHGFSTRAAGDFALLRDRARLAEAQDRLGRALGFEQSRLHQATQVHGRTVAIASGDPSALVRSEADALVAHPGSGHAVGVRVADCVPILVGDPDTGRVAAIHAGWRGVEAGVSAATFTHLSSGSPSRFVAAIGPCIGACCFEVGGDVADRIAAASTAEVVVRRAGEKAFVDLRQAARAQLLSLGMVDDRVDDVPGPGREGCTVCDAERFHSYRRDGDASGRLIGVIVAR